MYTFLTIGFSDLNLTPRKTDEISPFRQGWDATNEQAQLVSSPLRYAVFFDGYVCPDSLSFLPRRSLPAAAYLRQQPWPSAAAALNPIWRRRERPSSQMSRARRRASRRRRCGAGRPDGSPAGPLCGPARPHPRPGRALSTMR
jgi:hypothetical protein